MGATDVDDIYELSPLQQGMLLHTVHDGASDMYLGQHVYVVEGRLDADVLVRAWRRVFAAHPALRTSFHWEGLDKPLQVVHRDVTPPAHHEDWSDLGEELQRDRLEKLLADDRGAGFDLTAAPLQRLYLVRLGDDRHALAWTHHHLLLDGWSVPVFMNEVMTHYRALTAGGPPPPPAPPFRDYIAWLQRQDTDAARAFWTGTLGGVVPRRPAALRPADPRRSTGEPERHTVGIGGGLEEALRAAAARHRVTLGTVLQAAWAVVLSRLTGSPEVVFGSVSSGRPPELPDVDRMIGMFITTLPVPVAVPDAGATGPWLRDLQARYAAIRRYESSPLSDIKRWSGVPGQQLYDSLVVIGNYSFAVEGGGTGGLSVRSQTTFDKVSVPLSVIVTPAPVSELQLLLHPGRFDPGFAEDVLDRLLTVLDAFTRTDDVAEVVTAAGALVEAVPVDAAGRAAPPVPGAPVQGPETPEEEAIAAVYRELLELDEVDVTTSFFDLGGDSFGAVRAVGRIEGATVTMLALNPTVRGLAGALAAAGPGVDEDLDAEIAELERQLAENAERIERARRGEPVEEPAAADPSGAPDDLQRGLTEYYEGVRDEEEERADSGHGVLEFERTQEILLRHLPPAPAVVADIGGGLGRFALWLAGLGYRVEHRDIVAAHVEHVRRAAAEAGADVGTAVGDARELDLADGTVDAVLLLGPLYHLPAEDDRLRVLREAHRVLRPGGVVFGAAVSRWAARLDGVLRERLYERGPEIMDLIDSVERTGVLPPLAKGGYTAYTHTPDELRAELGAAGLAVADLVSVEGAAFLLDDLGERMADPRARAAVLQGARAHERVPELLGIGPHLIVTGLRS